MTRLTLLALALIGSAAFTSVDARGQPFLVTQDRVSDPAIRTVVEGFFAAQTAKDLERTMAYLSPRLVTYADATLGTEHPNYAALEAVFAKAMPSWGDGRVLPRWIIGGPDSAIVAYTTTPEIWGAELKILAAVDLADGKIVRWVDYFDGQAYAAEAFAAMRAPQADIPATFGEDSITDNADPGFVDVVRRWQTAVSIADQAALRNLLAPGAVFEDLTLQARWVGADAVVASIERSFISAPYSRRSRLRHIVGGKTGGGYEWIGGNGLETVLGAMTLELDAEGRIFRITTLYDGRQLPPERLETLLLVARED